MDLKHIEKLKPFHKFIMTIGELPSSYLESMTYAEMLLWFCDFLQNTVIPTVNNNAKAVEELQNLFVQLHDYVENYFNNLDVQDEINNKLDALVADGTFERLLLPYFNAFKAEINSEINIQNNKINALSNATPIPVSSVNNMIDTSKVYVNINDGYWYYYNGTAWVRGGIYQGVADSLESQKNSTNIELIKNTFYDMPDFAFEKGRLSEGNILPSDTRVVTSDIIQLNRDIRFYIDFGFKFALNYYNDDDSFSSDSGWIESNQTYFANGFVIIPANTKFRICISENNNLNLNVYDYVKHLHYDYIYFNKLKMSDSDNIKEYIKNSNVLRLGNYYVNDSQLKFEWTSKSRAVMRLPVSFSQPLKITNNNENYRVEIYLFNSLDSDLNAAFDKLLGEINLNESIIIPKNQYFTIKFIKNIVTDISNIEFYSLIDSLSFELYPNCIDYENLKKQVISTGKGSYFGNKIQTTPWHFAISNRLYNLPVPSNHHVQAMAINNNVGFQFYSNDLVQLIDLQTGTPIATLDSSPSYHADVAYFTNLKYDENDEFNLCMVSDDTHPNIYLLRITRESVSLIKTLKFDPSIVGNSPGFAYDNINQLIYIIGYGNDLPDPYSTKLIDYSKDRMKISVWDYSTLTENQDGTYTPALLKSSTIPWQAVSQDITFFNNKIYMLNSTSVVAFPSSIIVLNTDDLFTIDTIIELYDSFKNAEVEGLDWYNINEQAKLMFTLPNGNFYDITM